MKEVGFNKDYQYDRDRELRKNGEGYPDPTAYEAIRRADGDVVKFRKTIGAIRRICELAGYDLEEHVVLKDRKTGRVWR